MTDPAATDSCLVTLLIPHPRRDAVLVADVSPAPTRCTLPSVRVDGTEPPLAAILDAVEGIDLSGSVVLRLVATSADPDVPSATATATGEKPELTLMLEFDAVGPDAPSGWRWQELDDGVVGSLEPDSARVAVGAWLTEQTDGPSPLRPPWSRPGWFARAAHWMSAQLQAAGHAVTAEPRLHHLWGVSAVVRARTADGDAFLKCSAGAFQREAAVTRALAEAMPAAVPEVIAVDAGEGWLLMRDLGAAELGDQDPTRWSVGLEAMAGIQRSWTDRTDELVGLGLPVRSLTDLALDVEATASDSVLLSRLSVEVRTRWLAAVPSLAEACRRLDRIGPDPTLVHGDLHPWNVSSGSAAVRVFDWTDAAISHPFVDLVTYVLRTDDVSLRRSLMAAYLASWSADLSAERLQQGADLALVVGALYQVQTYRMLLPTLLGNGADDGMRDGDLQWIKLSLTCLEQGIETPAW